MNKEEFDRINENVVWTMPHCGTKVSGRPHYRDEEGENNYIICPICLRKIYIND